MARNLPKYLKKSLIPLLQVFPLVHLVDVFSLCATFYGTVLVIIQMMEIADKLEFFRLLLLASQTAKSGTGNPDIDVYLEQVIQTAKSRTGNPDIDVYLEQAIQTLKITNRWNYATVLLLVVFDCAIVYRVVKLAREAFLLAIIFKQDAVERRRRERWAEETMDSLNRMMKIVKEMFNRLVERRRRQRWVEEETAEETMESINQTMETLKRLMEQWRRERWVEEETMESIIKVVRIFQRHAERICQQWRRERWVEETMESIIQSNYCDNSELSSIHKILMLRAGVFKICNISAHHVNDVGKCAICTNAFVLGEEAIEMPCHPDHIFHYHCIQTMVTTEPFLSYFSRPLEL